MIRIAILYPADPAGYVPSGIDSFIRSQLKWAPIDLDFTVIGASSDLDRRPLGVPVPLLFGKRRATLLPLVSVDPAARRNRMPLTVRYMWALRRHVRRGGLRDFDVLDFHRIEQALLFGRDPRPKNLVMHTDMSIIREPGNEIMWRYIPWLYESLERRLFPKFRHIFSVRQSAVERYSKNYPWLRESISFLANAVDTEIFHPARDGNERHRLRTQLLAELGANADARVVVFVGRLDHSKDPLLLLDAFATLYTSHPTAHLALVGDGILRAALRDKISALDLENRVTLLGARPPSEIADLLRAADLFVLSSAYEGMPLALLEALASGLPAVSTDVGEVRRVVHDDANGFVAPRRTATDVGNLIGRALDEQRRLSGEPCLSAVAQYTPQATLQNMFARYRMTAPR